LNPELVLKPRLRTYRLLGCNLRRHESTPGKSLPEAGSFNMWRSLEIVLLGRLGPQSSDVAEFHQHVAEFALSGKVEAIAAPHLNVDPARRTNFSNGLSATIGEQTFGTPDGIVPSTPTRSRMLQVCSAWAALQPGPAEVR